LTGQAEAALKKPPFPEMDFPETVVFDNPLSGIGF